MIEALLLLGGVVLGGALVLWLYGRAISQAIERALW